jgi:hypothetical protein
LFSILGGKKTVERENMIDGVRKMGQIHGGMGQVPPARLIVGY